MEPADMLAVFKRLAERNTPFRLEERMFVEPKPKQEGEDGSNRD